MQQSQLGLQSMFHHMICPQTVLCDASDKCLFYDDFIVFCFYL